MFLELLLGEWEVVARCKEDISHGGGGGVGRARSLYVTPPSPPPPRGFER